MKKIFLTIVVFMSFLLLSMTVSAQNEQTETPYAVSLQGGYSWLNGVVGGDVQIGHIGLSGGWMPTKMPMTNEKISSVGIAVTAYSDVYYENSWFVSLGSASNGYRYEDSNGYGATSPMTIVMVGDKYGSDDFNMKLGIGYGWCDYGNAWTFEATIGFKLFGN